MRAAAAEAEALGGQNMAWKNWFIVALAVSASVVAFWFALIGVPFLLVGQPWLAPGDPPIFDMLVELGIVPVVLSACAWCASQVWQGPGRLALRLARASFVVSATLVVVGALGVAERHGPRWSAIRSVIRHHATEIDEAVGGRGRVLSRAEFEATRQRFMPRPVPVWFAGVGFVLVRMAHGAYPFVVVDFGEGIHVEFEPVTMWSIYAD